MRKRKHRNHFSSASAHGTGEAKEMSKKTGAKKGGTREKTNKAAVTKRPAEPREPTMTDSNFVYQVYAKRPTQAHLSSGLQHHKLISGDASMNALHKRKRKFLENFRKK